MIWHTSNNAFCVVVSNTYLFYTTRLQLMEGIFNLTTMVDPTTDTIQSVVSSLLSVSSNAKDINRNAASLAKEALSWIFDNSINQNVTYDVVRPAIAVLDRISTFIAMQDLVTLIEQYVQVVSRDMLPGQVCLLRCLLECLLRCLL